MKTPKTEEELEWAAECHLVSLSVTDILNCIEYKEDRVEFERLVSLCKEKYVHEKRVELFKQVRDIGRQVLETSPSKYENTTFK